MRRHGLRGPASGRAPDRPEAGAVPQGFHAFGEIPSGIVKPSYGKPFPAHKTISLWPVRLFAFPRAGAAKPLVRLIRKCELSGMRLLAGYVDAPAQRTLLDLVLENAASAPFYTPRMPKTGAAMSVRQTNFGPLGWVTDQALGYRYQDTHPETGAAWPPIPAALLALWRDVAGYPDPPEACLVNHYQDDARMGLHVDADEQAGNAPVVSVSLGDKALFRIGGARRNDPTRSVWLSSGDVVILEGPSRRAYHGVDRIAPGTSRLVPGGGRINLTLRRVSA